MSYPGVEYDELSRSLLCPSEYRNPEPKDKYHLAIIGAGPAGLIAAIGAAGLGAKVALIEGNLMGGDCLNVGCVPSKALLEYTKGHPQGNFDQAFTHLRAVRAGIAPHDSVARYNELGADVFLGRARFNPDGSIQVGGQTISARRYCVATGARAAMPPIPGLDQVAYLTNESLFDLAEQPRSLAILGGGAIGCEMATVFARLGSEVHLFEMAERILPLEDQRASQPVAESLKDLGVQIHVGKAVEAVEQTADGIAVSCGSKVNVERVLVAAGRRANTDNLGLQDIGVRLNGQGLIETDDKLRTHNKSVYAAGDCASPIQFTHYADACARVVVQNALFAPTASMKGKAVTRCTYTDPEVAAVERADAEQLATDEYTFPLADLDRSRAQGDDAGLAIVQTEKGGDKVVSATIVGAGAGELVAVLAVLTSNNLGLSALSNTLLPYPTRSEFNKRLADAYNRTRMTPLLEKLFKLWLNRTA